MAVDGKLHIGFLTERMTLGFGVDVVIHEQAVRLVERGYAVTVFPGWKTDLYEGQPYKLVPLTKASDEPLSYYSPDFLNRSFAILNQHQVDVWMIHTPPFYYWLSHLPPPVIMVEHGTPPGKFFSYRQGKALDYETRKRQRSVFRNRRPGDGLVAISEYIRSSVPVDVQRSMVVIHNGADHYPRTPATDREKCRRNLNIKPTDIMVLWVGRVQPVKDPQPYKGLSVLLRTAKILNETKLKIRLVAVGRGDPSADTFLREAGIIPLLNHPREKMAAVYAAADVFLNTSSWEGFNLPLAEAQYQGTPVIALNLCAHPEIVSNGFSGVLVDRSQDLADAVLELARDADLRKRLGEGALRHIAEFTWDKNVTKLEKLIHGCLKIIETGKRDVPVEVLLKKNLRYYLDFAGYLLRHFGWKTFLVECVGWLGRRRPFKPRD